MITRRFVPIGTHRQFSALIRGDGSNSAPKRALRSRRRHYNLIDVRPFAPNLGAEVRGIDLASGITDAQFEEVREAFLEHQVLFFKDQSPVSPPVHVAICRRFGELHVHPAAPTDADHPEIFVIHAHAGSKIANGEFWHSDVSCDEEPPLGTMLQIRVLPDVGGDTLFADAYAAWEALSAPMQAMLRGLHAVHESEHIYRGRYADRGAANPTVYPTAVHPVARTHPDTGRTALYVNRAFTTGIAELAPDEGEALLGFLLAHTEKVEFQIRFKWERDDVAFWDNRCTMHRALWDYWPEERKGHRVTVKGDRPV